RRAYLDLLADLHAKATADSSEAGDLAWSRVLRAMELPPRAATAPGTSAWQVPAVEVDVSSRSRAGARVLRGAFPASASRWPWLLATAAALAIVAAGVVSRGAGRGAAPAQSPAMRQVATARGQRAEIRLDDGTRVILGVASRLEIPGAYGVSSRDLYLDGTAYFEVVHDTTRPFVVHTRNAVAQDVGTRFVVRDYGNANGTLVAVTDGSVSLRASGVRRGGEVLVTRDHLGELAAGARVPSVSAADLSRYTAWMRGELEFHDAPLTEVVAELERWYNVDLAIGDASLKRVPLSASFAAESFADALSVITTVLPVRAVRAGHRVTLYRR
ncbi:MAG TPA: FecR domain-containing protein, partial [Gemmatimonadaceae bacterium]|nr:FecR domain-containing protein [Gemmatimonadaceae bacterium]